MNHELREIAFIQFDFGRAMGSNTDLLGKLDAAGLDDSFQSDFLLGRTVVFGCDGFDGLLAVENFDQSLAEGVMFLTPFSADSTDELTQNFVSKFTENFGGTPNQFAADAYDCVYVIKAAAEKAGITPSMSASEICDAMKTAMTEISYDGLTGSQISWGADGEPEKAPIVVKVENGAYTILK